MLDSFEYMRRPLTTETTPADLDELGADGWELCGVVGRYGWFKRSRVARALHEQGERQATELGRPTGCGGRIAPLLADADCSAGHES